MSTNVHKNGSGFAHRCFAGIISIEHEQASHNASGNACFLPICKISTHIFVLRNGEPGHYMVTFSQQTNAQETKVESCFSPQTSAARTAKTS